MVHQSDVFGVNQFSPENIHGVYNDGDRATGIAEKLVREMHVSMAQLEEKKGKVSDKLQKAITKLLTNLKENYMSDAKPVTVKATVMWCNHNKLNEMSNKYHFTGI